MIFPNIFLFDLLHQSHENHGMFISKNAQNFHIVKPWCHLAARHCLSGLQHPLQLNRTRCSVGLSPGWTARDLWRRWGLSVQLEPCGFPFCGEKGGKTRSRSISQGLEINGTNEKKTKTHFFRGSGKIPGRCGATTNDEAVNFFPVPWMNVSPSTTGIQKEELGALPGPIHRGTGRFLPDLPECQVR